MRNIKRRAALVMAAVMAGTGAFASMGAPQSAYSEEVWQMLRDNVMEYGELPLLVEEYSPYYLNNLASYTDSKSDEDARDLRQTRLDSAGDLDSSADDMDASADDMMASIEEMAAAGISGAGSMASGYAAMKKAAANLRQNALRTYQTADASYEDAEVRSLQLQSRQRTLVVQTQKLFASYHLANAAIPVLENSLAKAERNATAVQNRIAAGTALASDLLAAQNTVRQVEASLGTARANVESLRRSLLLNTGWQVTDSPEIRGIPDPDLALAETFNPDADAPAAIESNLTLRLYRQQLSNMAEDSVDYQNMVRTIAVEEQTVRSTLRQKYDAIREGQLAFAQARAACETERRNLAAAEVKRTAGMITQNALLDQREQAASAEVDLETARISLQQAIESYRQALEGVL